MCDCEEVKALFQELKRIVGEIRDEEKRSHGEREALIRNMVVEIRLLRSEIDKTNKILDEILGILREARIKLEKTLL